MCKVFNFSDFLSVHTFADNIAFSWTFNGHDDVNDRLISDLLIWSRFFDMNQLGNHFI